jgi:hypothetical protein
MLYDSVNLVGDSKVRRELVSRRGTTLPASPVNGQLFQLTVVDNTYQPGVYMYSVAESDWVLQTDEEDNPYDMAITGPGRPKADAVIAQAIMVRTMVVYAGFERSLAICGVPPTAEAVFEINVLDKQGNQIDQLGTITFAVGTIEGVINPARPTEQSLLQAGEVISIKAPTIRDATIQNISITLAGKLAILND